MPSRGPSAQIIWYQAAAGEASFGATGRDGVIWYQAAAGEASFGAMGRDGVFKEALPFPTGPPSTGLTCDRAEVGARGAGLKVRVNLVHSDRGGRMPSPTAWSRSLTRCGRRPIRPAPRECPGQLARTPSSPTVTRQAIITRANSPVVSSPRRPVEGAPPAAAPTMSYRGRRRLEGGAAAQLMMRMPPSRTCSLMASHSRAVMPRPASLPAGQQVGSGTPSTRTPLLKTAIFSPWPP